MKTISATEAKNRLGTYLRHVARGEGEIVIQNHGIPAAVLVPFDRYRSLREVEDRQRRRDAMDAIRQLRDEVRSRNLDLSAAEADAIADDVGREAAARVVARIQQQAKERPA